MRKLIKIVFIVVFLFVLINEAMASRKLRDRRLERVCVLSDTQSAKAYKIKEPSRNYFDLAIHLKVLLITYIIVWTFEKIKFVMVNKNDTEKSGDLTNKHLNRILKSNKLRKEDFRQLNWYLAVRCCYL